MAWSINVIKNSVIILDIEIQKEIIKKIAEMMGYDDPYDADLSVERTFNRDGKIMFHEDDMEHMDFLTHNDQICGIIASSGAEGEVCFGSFEGDNKGSFWGVSFKEGTWTRLKAGLDDISWKEVPAPDNTLSM